MNKNQDTEQDMSDTLPLKWSRYIPKDHKPFTKQAAFLALPHREALYGGSAGGGKSDCLLMGALQYVDVPGYAAIVFRRQLTDANLPGSVMSRAKEWLMPYVKQKIIKWNSSEATFVFPSGATLTFGYLSEANAHFRYQGAEFSFIGFDELTQFQENQYTYLFSRLRKKLPGVPLRIRAASNPGGVGHTWVKNRFDIRKNKKTGQFYGNARNRPFIPSFAQDNPFLDNTYVDYLDNLSDLDKRQLKYGDWSAQELAQFKELWFENRYRLHRGTDTIYQLVDKKGVRSYHTEDLELFGCIDPAASEKTGVQGVAFKNDYNPSWTVLGIFARTKDHELLVLDWWRDRCSIPEIPRMAADLTKRWKPRFWRVESNGPGEGVYASMVEMGFSVKEIRQNRDKVVNASTAVVRASNGQIWLPGAAPWLRDLEGELFSWTGNKKEEDDQIDVISSAANEIAEKAAGYEFDPSVLKAKAEITPLKKFAPKFNKPLWHS